MGIPSYFSYIIKNYPNIIQKYLDNEFKVDNLYLDCNSIIYDVYSKIEFDTLTETVTINIIKNVIIKIEEYISIINPSKTVMIAFDGVAPIAKLEQQRARRYKSWYQNMMNKNIFKNEKEDPWNTAAITPGTKFMSELNDMISTHFFNKNNTYEIIVSGSNAIGEGEHKLFQFIRDNKEKHSNETTIIYGLDADLIMLSINHLNICPNIYLFRETPHFIQSIDSSLEPNANYIMDIPELTTSIIKYMNNDRDIDISKQKNKVFDYVFLCFFLGNDFLPHFPALNIRTGGVDKMMNAYKATIGDSNENLTDGKTIYWKNVRKMVEHLAKLEEEFIVKEHRSRNYKQNNFIPENTPQEKFKKFECIPLYERETEQYINPLKPYWQYRYYRSLFSIKSDSNNEQKKDIAINYLQGLEWTMKYYSLGCLDWRWRYKYNYPPLLQDLLHFIPIFETTFVQQKPINPVSEFVQLCYVLPRNSLNLLPEKLYYELIRRYDHWYRSDWDFIWAFCRYFWESHVEMNDIDINELENFIHENKHLLL
uniref:Xrn1 N-terminal domain-containing protein n=1 Tax=viral metagenome TaxID=1070528 RepID=A0A6C0KP21_9ZZZZ